MSPFLPHRFLKDMDISYNTLETSLRHSIVVFGHFDGVHLGYRRLFESLRKEGKSVFAAVARGAVPSYGDDSYLTSYDDRCLLLRREDISGCIYCSEGCSPESFLSEILCEFDASQIIVADDILPPSMPYERHTFFPTSLDVRRVIEDGEVRSASELLGRDYSLPGTVVHGREVGKNLGFPTANISFKHYVLPRRGVYATQTVVLGEPTPFLSMTNIGTRPTFLGDGVTVETHLFDFSGNLYNKSLTVFFSCRLRNERRFDSVDDLITQLGRDAAECRSIKPLLRR